MPKTIYIQELDGGSSGIDITWTKSTQRLAIGGWYDSMVGIGGKNFSLREFFDALGITEKDCLKTFKEKTK